MTELESVLRLPEKAELLAEPERLRMKFFAFCAIGNPLGFFDDLRRWGISTVGEHRFRDHHRYTEAEVGALAAAAVEARADALICTEKDAFNLPAALKAHLPIYACRIRMRLPDADGFWNAIIETVQRRRASPRQ